MIRKSWSDYSQYFYNDRVVAGFTNNSFPYSPPEDRIEFANELNLQPKNLVIPKQVHSNNIAVVTESGIYSDTDGIITNQQDLVLSIQVADCIPIFISDIESNAIGLIHAGWRGIAANIIENSIEKFQSLNSNPRKLEVVLGPSIRQCCFEIGPEVSTKFDEKYQLEGVGDRSYLNPQSVVIDKFIQLGVEPQNITNVEECTCCSEHYHSFRRDGSKAGRMIGILGIGRGVKK